MDEMPRHSSNLLSSCISTFSKPLLIQIFNRLRQTGRRKSKIEQSDEERRKTFKIPAEVPDRKHFVKDEISELTTTFNAMSRELLLQYTSLETKVAERTQVCIISSSSSGLEVDSHRRTT